jgi:hypothetical protein
MPSEESEKAVIQRLEGYVRLLPLIVFLGIPLWGYHLVMHPVETVRWFLGGGGYPAPGGGDRD